MSDSDTAPLLRTWQEAGHDLGGLSRRQVYRLIDQGELCRVKIGSRLFITRDSIEGYVERLTRARAADA
jgi:excisionase family DNA binding protein